jgi:GTP-binding protein
MLDVTDETVPNEAYTILHRELEQFDSELVERPFIVCLNKTDLVDEDWLDLCEQELRKCGVENLHRLSALTGDGTKKLVQLIADLLEGRVREPWES